MASQVNVPFGPLLRLMAKASAPSLLSKEDRKQLVDAVDAEARTRGYGGWREAYHHYKEGS